jgi:hypothetical protein
LPLAQIATAMPRRRSNQSAVSATSGAKLAELPTRPSSTPWTIAKLQMLVAYAAATKPAPRPSAPMTSGSATPRRSASRPMKTPPTPKPTISSVYGSDASARALPNSACTLGKTTATTYIALEPIVISTSATARRVQA